MGLIYSFEDGVEDKGLLGNKGANLVIAAKLGLPVPPAFILSVEAYELYKRTGSLPLADIDRALGQLEKEMGRGLGRGLAVSVRSSAAASMPGMMDTVLNIRDKESMLAAIKRVFGSWDNLRAVEYRKINRISSELGTACVVQAMVFGNRDERSGTGVAFSRNPSTGENVLFGEYLPQALGEELVSGVKTPGTIEDLRSAMPQVCAELQAAARRLENHFRDVQDIEFTVESGKLYILQSRAGKRSGQAAVKIAVDLAEEELISHQEALMRVTYEDVRGPLHKRLKSPQQYQPLTSGLAAAPGAASGRVLFNPLEVKVWASKNEKTILVRPETSPDDIQGIASADGVLTSRGGLTSHAAIVTRAMGKACVCGAENMKIDLRAEQFEVQGQVVRKGTEITVDGSTGNIYLGALPLEESEMTPELRELLAWADSYRRLGVRANADTVEVVRLAKKFGAEGIGLCRTERQFNVPERLTIIREFMLAKTAAERMDAIERLRRLQRDDFVVIFRELAGMPIAVRLLDLPLHEFLPPDGEIAEPELRERIRELKEVNPMLGHRGVRLGITNPEIYAMQIDAICDAYTEARKSVEVNVSIIVPQVVTLQELLWVKKHVRETGLKFGVMMETARACMRAGKLAQVADFFTFGTNDLTQSVYAFSREDVEKKFLSTYLEMGILEDNPFEVIDVKGVGRLMETAISWARMEKKDLEIGVCGEHGGEPRSIKYFHRIGVDYVSCSPFRVPHARLVAAQAAIEDMAKGASGVRAGLPVTP